MWFFRSMKVQVRLSLVSVVYLLKSALDQSSQLRRFALSVKGQSSFSMHKHAQSHLVWHIDPARFLGKGSEFCCINLGI